jgi:release factor glutamine methyltransferase
VHIRRLLVYAGDLSGCALLVSKANARKHFVEEQVCPYQGDLGGCLGKPLDLVCANLPYIPTQALKQLPVYGKEPTQALDGGKDGMKLIRSMLEDAPRYLAPGGLLLAEIEESQGPAVFELANQAFPGSSVDVLQDLAGKDRLLRVVNLDA